MPLTGQNKKELPEEAGANVKQTKRAVKDLEYRLLIPAKPIEATLVVVHNAVPF